MLRTGRRGFEASRSPTAASLGLLGRGSTLFGETTSPSDWQLAAGHYIDAKISPVIIHPRPDSETAAFERCRRAPSGIQWRIPITVLGGAYPFHFELLQAPTGATIGQNYWDTDYGIVSWDSPTVGTHTFEVAVYDQQLRVTPITRVWTLEIIDRENTTYFLFLDAASGSNSNSGAYSSPKLNVAGWWGANKADATHAGKQIFYRAGTYLVTDSTLAGSSNQQFQQTVNKPYVHVGFPGETAIIDGANTGYWDLESSVPTGISFCGLRWQNCSVPEGPPNRRKQFVRFSTNATRALIFENFFDGGGDTQSNNGTNSSCVMFASTTVTNEYMAVSHNTFHNCDNMDFVLYYASYRFVAEHCTVTGTYGVGTHNNPGWGFFAKGVTCDTWSWRAITAISAGIARPTFHFSEFNRDGVGGPFYRRNGEVCWNNVVNPFENTTQTRASGPLAIGQGGSANANGYGYFWSYRNNYRSAYMAFQALEEGPFQFENDCIQHDGTYSDGIGLVDCPGVSVITVAATDINQFAKVNLATATSGMFDSTTNLLTGSARTAYLGTHGSEIA